MLYLTLLLLFLVELSQAVWIYPAVLSCSSSTSAVPSSSLTLPTTATTSATPTPTASPEKLDLVAHHFELPLDHDGSVNTTFQNRYWTDDTYYVPGGPVMLFDCGETSAARYLPTLHTSYMGAHARAFNASIIVWEHRFYGESFPPLPTSLSSGAIRHFYRFLTIGQALQDLSMFARSFASTPLSPALTPWIIAGGSYPGARAAWPRAAYPELFYAALASSAVVEVRPVNSGYWEVIETAIRDAGMEDCVADMVGISAWVDSAPDEEVEAWAVNAGADEGLSQIETVTSLLGLPTKEFQSYGWGGNGMLKWFCTALRARAGGAGAGGVFKAFAAERAREEYAGALLALLEWKGRIDEAVANATAAAAAAAGQPAKRTKRDIKEVDDTDEGKDDKSYDCAANVEDCMDPLSSSWSFRYQRCSEFGNFATVPLHGGIFPYKYWSATVTQRVICDDFDIPSLPSSNNISAQFGGWGMESSNTLFVDGEIDPWRSAGVNSHAEGAPRRETTSEVPGAGEVVRGKVFGTVVKGAGHVPDFGDGWVEGGLGRGHMSCGLGHWGCGCRSLESTRSR